MVRRPSGMTQGSAMAHSSVRPRRGPRLPRVEAAPLLGFRACHDQCRRCRAAARPRPWKHVDWNKLVKLASDHRVTPLLYRSLNTVCPDAVPAATLALLERDFSANHARNLALAFELRELVKTLAAHEISSIPFQGAPPLASRGPMAAFLCAVPETSTSLSKGRMRSGQENCSSYEGSALTMECLVIESSHTVIILHRCVTSARFVSRFTGD